MNQGKIRRAQNWLLYTLVLSVRRILIRMFYKQKNQTTYIPFQLCTFKRDAIVGERGVCNITCNKNNSLYTLRKKEYEQFFLSKSMFSNYLYFPYLNRKDARTILKNFFEKVANSTPLEIHIPRIQHVLSSHPFVNLFQSQILPYLFHYYPMTK